MHLLVYLHGNLEVFKVDVIFLLVVAVLVALLLVKRVIVLLALMRVLDSLGRSVVVEFKLAILLSLARRQFGEAETLVPEDEGGHVVSLLLSIVDGQLLQSFDLFFPKYLFANLPEHL